MFSNPGLLCEISRRALRARRAISGERAPSGPEGPPGNVAEQTRIWKKQPGSLRTTERAAKNVLEDSPHRPRAVLCASTCGISVPCVVWFARFLSYNQEQQACLHKSISQCNNPTHRFDNTSFNLITVRAWLTQFGKNL